MKALHPIRFYRNFKARCAATCVAVCNPCHDAIAAIRTLTEAIHSHSERVSELHADIKKIERAVGFLHRAERYQRETNGYRVNF